MTKDDTNLIKATDVQSKRSARNYVVGLVLMALAVLFYFITVAKMGGHK